MKKGDSVAGKVKLRYKGKGKERYVRVIRWKREWVTELTRSAWRFFLLSYENFNLLLCMQVGIM